MAYPWAGFGAFLFQREEWPLPDTDTGWNRSPSINRSRPLGSATDDIVALAIGSAERSFECHLSPSRYAALEALVNTTNSFTDWSRPIPDSRSAYLAKVTQLAWVAALCSDGSTERKIRARIELVSQ
jgi:fructose-1,6-bisphosphatase/inositol monophosphatase family enzyme